MWMHYEPNHARSFYMARQVYLVLSIGGYMAEETVKTLVEVVKRILRKDSGLRSESENRILSKYRHLIRESHYEGDF